MREQNLAEENKQQCDEMLETVQEDEGCEVGYVGLQTRYVSHKDKGKLDSVMNWLTGSFSFEAKEIFVSGEYCYEITLPNIIIDC